MKVSLVIAVFNGAWCIERGLESVLSQTRPVDEVLVCDDGSTDGTADLVERRFGDRVTVLRLEHNNAPTARAAGLDRASGDWLAFMDCDDTWLPEKVERQLACIAEHPEIRLVCSDGHFVSETEVLRESWLSDYFDPVEDMIGDLYPALLERCFALHSSIMIEAKAYREVGGVDTNMLYSCDYDIALKCAARYPSAVMKDRLVTYLSSPHQLSRHYEARYLDDLEVLQRAALGEYREKASEQARAAERTAAIHYDLGQIYLRSGRVPQGRRHLRHAAGHGPWQRRLLAAAGSLLPPWAVPLLMRSTALKGLVQGAREVKEKIEAGDEYRGAA